MEMAKKKVKKKAIKKPDLMTYSGKKGKKKFTRVLGIYKGKAVPMTDLSVAWEADQNDTTQAVKRTQKLVELDFSVTLSRALGRNPLTDLNNWRKLLGCTGVLKIGGKKFGAKKFSLRAVEISDYILDDFGKFYLIRLALSFIEKNKAKSKRLKASKSDKADKKPDNKNVKNGKDVKKNGAKSK
jgi:hypothetical protein